MADLIEGYLATLRRELRVSSCFVERILSEIEDHLLEGAEREHRHGATLEEAQRIVIERFGSADVVARWWSEVYASENGASNMWQRFTERARRVVFFAQEEAARLGGNLVGTEHLLLGLLREEDSVAGRMLTQLGVAAGHIRSETEKQVKRGQGNLGEPMELTPRAKRMIDLAYEEARRLNNNYIGTEHLLLGLILEEEGLGGRVLRSAGADLARTREIVESMQETSPQVTAGTSASPSAAGDPPAAPVPSAATPPAAPSSPPAPPTPTTASDAPGDAPPAASAAASPAAQAPPPASVPPIPTWLRPGEAPPPAQTPWAKFNERARRVLLFAREAAAGFGENYFGTEHLLLGILREPVHVAGQMLERLGISRERIRERIEQQTTRGQRNPEQTVEATPRARRVMELAYAEAESLSHNYIGTEHLLLGLIREGDGLAARVLAELGADLEQARGILRAGGFATPPPTGESILWEVPFWLPPQPAPVAGIPWAKLTERARRVVFMAHEEAMRFGYRNLQPDCLLLALAREDSLATRILEHMGISIARLRGEVEKQMQQGPGWSQEMCQLAPDVQSILERAWEEAQSMNHNYLGAEHVLLGFLRMEGLPMSAILVRLGVRPERVREAIPVVGVKWAAILEASRRLEEAEADYRALLVSQ